MLPDWRRLADTIDGFVCKSPHYELARDCHTSGRMKLPKSSRKVNIFAVTRAHFVTIKVELPASLVAQSKSGARYVSMDGKVVTVYGYHFGYHSSMRSCRREPQRTCYIASPYPGVRDM